VILRPLLGNTRSPDIQVNNFKCRLIYEHITGIVNLQAFDSNWSLVHYELSHASNVDYWSLWRVTENIVPNLYLKLLLPVQMSIH